MKRVYKHNDIKLCLSLNDLKYSVDLIKAIEFKFYTVNKTNSVIKTKDDIVDYSLILEWNDLKDLEQGVLYYDYRVSVCDTDLEDGTFDSVTNNITDYYIMSGKKSVDMIKPDYIEWGNLRGDISKQLDLVDYLNIKVNSLAGRKTPSGGEIFNIYSGGNVNKALEAGSHAEGIGTIARNDSEHAQGKFNRSNPHTRSSIGIGTSNENRLNAVEVMDDGRIYVKGIGGYDGTNIEESMSLQRFLNELDYYVFLRYNLVNENFKGKKR